MKKKKKKKTRLSQINSQQSVITYFNHIAGAYTGTMENLSIQTSYSHSQAVFKSLFIYFFIFCHP
jgi:hypothetical protein